MLLAEKTRFVDTDCTAEYVQRLLSRTLRNPIGIGLEVSKVGEGTAAFS
jgi:hypothetical protein